MSTFVNSISLVTQSFNTASVTTNQAALYASGSNIYFANDAGIVYNLTEDTIVYEYIATGSHTWVKPLGLREIIVMCAGAGGGGGSGGLQTGNRVGGGGGAGGTIVTRVIPTSQLTQSSYTVVVGVGGAGGLPASGSPSSGPKVGSAGGSSSFQPFVVAVGGSGGPAGGSAASAQASLPSSGTPITNCVPNYGPYAATGAGTGRRIQTVVATRGGHGLANTSLAVQNTVSITQGWGYDTFCDRPGCPAGGVGGGSTGGQIRSGSSGGGVYFNGILITGSAGGPGGGTQIGVTASAGLNDQAKSIPFVSGAFSTYGIGTGGGGGGCAGNALDRAGGQGGAGGRCAGGGGGGSTHFTGSNNTSGAGGRGGDGYCIIVERY